MYILAEECELERPSLEALRSEEEMEIGQSIRQAQSWSSSTFSHFTRLWRYAGFHLCLCDARVDCDMASQVWILPCPFELQSCDLAGKAGH